MMSQTIAALGYYLVGAEISDRINEKLKNAAISGSMDEYEKLIIQGYNPYRVDKDGKMPFEYAEDQETFCILASNWIGKLAYNTNPDTIKNDL